jgi:16S rRNA (uracil1498-N3)-methyltransferase
MARFFLSPDAWGEHATLTGDEAKHAAQVMRVRRGDHITVFDGAGRSTVAEVKEVSKSEIRLNLGEEVRRPLLRPAIHLVQAVPKGKTMDLIVQKAVELGVASIQPLISRRTVVQVEEEDAGRKAAKWQRVALEACKQCGQDLLPLVEPPLYGGRNDRCGRSGFSSRELGLNRATGGNSCIFCSFCSQIRIFRRLFIKITL